MANERGDWFMNEKALTLKELWNMIGQPVWYEELECWGIIGVGKHLENGEKVNRLYLLGYLDIDSDSIFQFDIAKRKLKLYRQKLDDRKDDE